MNTLSYFKYLIIVALCTWSMHGITVTQPTTPHNFVVSSGDTLSKYFKRLGLTNRLLINLVNSENNAKYLNNLRIGNRLVISTRDGKFKELRYQINAKKSLVTRLEGKRFFNRVLNHGQEYTFTQTNRVHVTVITTLSEAFVEVGLSKKHLDTFLEITSGVVSPNALPVGASFIIYLQDNNIIGISAKERSWYLWDGVYFDHTGAISSPMFLEAPLKYRRISSGFTYNRMHPILKVNLPHRAIDYAANRGTKIYAAADGVISFRAYKGALGNTVKVKHEHGYETTYAHLWRFRRGVIKGTKVKKGQVIGYVGSTGRSTGNHLHYELKKNGQYLNPLTHKPQLLYYLRGQEKTDFLTFIRQLQA